MKIFTSYFTSGSKCQNCSKKFALGKRRVCSVCSKYYIEALFCSLCSIKVKKHHNEEISNKSLCLVCYSKLSGPSERLSTSPKKYLNSAKHLRSSTGPLDSNLQDFSFSE